MREHGVLDRLLLVYEAGLRKFASNQDFDPAIITNAAEIVRDFIENYHTGGGLCRDLFSEFLEEASQVSAWAHLRPLSKRYAELGALWSDLAISAIPKNVPAFRKVHELCVQRAELRSGGDPADVETIRKVWDRLAELRKDAERDFPLSAAECADLQELLRGKVAALRDAEMAAHASLGQAITAK